MKHATRSPLLLLTLLALPFTPGCAAAPKVARSDIGLYGARDYLKTAWETLSQSETDTGGHRVRAQSETRAALEELGAISAPTRKVPFDGPPSLAIALELLEQSEREMQRMCSNDALIHARRAAAELRQALASK